MVKKSNVIKYVLNAIIELGDKNGSPLSSIIDLVRANIAIDNVKPKPRNIALHTRRALHLALEEGIVIEPTRGRYKIMMDEEWTKSVVPKIRSNTCKRQFQRPPLDARARKESPDESYEEKYDEKDVEVDDDKDDEKDDERDDERDDEKDDEKDDKDEEEDEDEIEEKRIDDNDSDDSNDKCNKKYDNNT